MNTIVMHGNCIEGVSAAQNPMIDHGLADHHELRMMNVKRTIKVWPPLRERPDTEQRLDQEVIRRL